MERALFELYRVLLGFTGFNVDGMDYVWVFTEFHFNEVSFGWVLPNFLVGFTGFYLVSSDLLYLFLVFVRFNSIKCVLVVFYRVLPGFILIE